MASSLILDSGGRAIQSAASPVNVTDTVTQAINAGILAGGNRFGPQNSFMERMFAPQMAAVAYVSSGMLQKTIDIPASDRVREWRDWQAEKDQIDAIEKEERRLNLLGKVKFAETLRGTGGGALLIIMKGQQHDQELKPETVSAQAIAAINVVRRDEIEPIEFDRELASPTYGEPQMWRVGQGGGEKKIHPSRVIAFRGDPYPSSVGVSEADQFWGISRLVRVYREVMRDDNAQAWFADLVRKAKLLRIGIPGLTDYTATAGGQARLNTRMGAIALSESGLNATVYDAGNGTTDPGEKIDDYQVNWSGMPAMMDAFGQRVAAVADIPFTRLMGRSPAGMNSTGEHDTSNYDRMVAAGQNLELRPCLEKLDPILLKSAGIADGSKLWWKFSPLSKPSPKDEADRFDKVATALGKIRDTDAMPEAAFNAGVQGVIEENGWMPGAAPQLAKLSEDERFGIAPDNDGTDPSAITQSGNRSEGGDPQSPTTRGAGGSNGAPARAVNDAKAIPLYVQRKLLNADELVRWAEGQGFKTTLEPSDMHVTILYSRTPVDPIKMGTTWSDDQKGNLTVKPGGPRAVEKLGDSAVVLLFASDDLAWRHRSMVEAGASHDYDEYQPHVTISHEVAEGLDIEAIKPFTGALRFGPELFEPLDLDWKQKITEE